MDLSCCRQSRSKKKKKKTMIFFFFFFFTSFNRKAVKRNWRYPWCYSTNFYSKSHRYPKMPLNASITCKWDLNLITSSKFCALLLMISCDGMHGAIMSTFIFLASQLVRPGLRYVKEDLTSNTSNCCKSPAKEARGSSYGLTFDCRLTGSFRPACTCIA